jgi:hypothetical protein
VCSWDWDYPAWKAAELVKVLCPLGIFLVAKAHQEYGSARCSREFRSSQGKQVYFKDWLSMRMDERKDLWCYTFTEPDVMSIGMKPLWGSSGLDSNT